jgi:1,4-dihydroxy-2-naphthoate octaprenyltransferase
MIKNWIEAFRLRTLPLALASIGMGSFLAASKDKFDGEVLLWCLLTTIFLQILSNLANDYGDTIHGADSVEREGPQRAVQAGLITRSQMLRAITLFVVLSLFSGIYLLYIAVEFNSSVFFGFLGLGVLAILASMAYTMGKRPYGYSGLGDISVLIFFGWVGVLGTFFLHTKFLDWQIMLPATSCGLFATAVLNLNNIRDIDSDKKAGKYSIPVRLGRKNATYYHFFLLGTALLTSIIYVGLNFSNYYQWLFLLVLPLLVINAKAVLTKKTAPELDPYLKQMAISTLVFVLTFGVGQIIG